MKDELRDRVVLPIAIPVGAIAVIGVTVFAFSRILLAVGKDMAVVVALAAALDILAVCLILAYRPPTPATYRFAAVVGVGLIVAGGIAMAAGERPVGPDAPDGAGPAEAGEAAPAAEPATQAAGAPKVRITAKNIVFNVKELSVKGGGDVVVEFRNADGGTPHNFAVYTDSSLGSTVFRGELFSGVKTTTHTFAAPPPGTYYFQCDVHPTMNGAFKVT